MKQKSAVVITMGDPAGIGPEVTIKALHRQRRAGVSFLVVGDSFVLQKTAALLKMSDVFKKISLIDLKNVDKKTFKFGRTRACFGRASVEYIKHAVNLIKAGFADALVTAPINKKAVNMAGFKWPGHTEYLAYLTGAKRFCMMLAGGPLKVVLVTRHTALRSVSRRLNAAEIRKTFILVHQALRKYFKIPRPKIAVCALNPHAGEAGLFSDEESRIIIPAIKKVRQDAPGVIGPFPADSLFFDAYHGKFDAQIAMYHDQGLIPLKMIAMDTGVNITLGLPFVRTSPAHGTAFDIAGRNKANPSSMIEAIKTAVKMVEAERL